MEYSSTSSNPLSSLGVQHRHTGTGTPASHRIIRLKRMVGDRGKKSHTLHRRRGKKLPYYRVVCREQEGGKKKLRMIVGAVAGASPHHQQE